MSKTTRRFVLIASFAAASALALAPGAARLASAQQKSGGPPQFQKPNLYHLTGEGMHVTYSTTSMSGKPMLTYQDQNGTKSFTGDEIRTAQTEIGTLVTVSLMRTIDSGSTSFSMLIPWINLTGLGQSVQFNTDGITTIHRFSPVFHFNQGATQIYSTHALSGSAQMVVF